MFILENLLNIMSNSVVRFFSLSLPWPWWESLPTTNDIFDWFLTVPLPTLEVNNCGVWIYALHLLLCCHALSSVFLQFSLRLKETNIKHARQKKKPKVTTIISSLSLSSLFLLSLFILLPSFRLKLHCGFVLRESSRLQHFNLLAPKERKNYSSSSP